MKFVVEMGYVFRVSERNYRRLLRTIAAGADHHLQDFGTQVCIIDKNITDLSPEDAQADLDWLASKKKED